MARTKLKTTDQIMQSQTVTLFDLLDRTINKGVVVEGQVMLTVADIDLVMLRLRLLLSGVETLYQNSNSSSPRSGNGERKQSYLSQSQALAAQVSSPELDRQFQKVLGDKREMDPEKVEQGLAKLVLTLVELLRRLMESQAIRRMEGGSLSPEEIERLGASFKRLEGRMKDLKDVFGLSDEELNLELGPLGKLM